MIEGRRIRWIACVVLGAGLLLPQAANAAGAEIPCAQHSDPRLAQMNDAGIHRTSTLGLPAGRYALPRKPAPSTLVVMFHGHGNDSCAWRRNLQEATKHGAIAVAMDYTGQRQTPVENYGWFVREGAADSIKAAKFFMSAYPSIKKVIAFGISMGGNTSGLAIASQDAVRTGGKPLFDYWIDIEGVNNLIEEYLVARGVAPVNSGGLQAQKEIEEETGGSLEAAPANYAAIDNVLQASHMSGLKGAIVVNGLDDGSVPTDQSPQMTAALTLAGVPTHQFTVLTRGKGEDGTTATSIAADPIFTATGQGTYVSPLAGHGWEGSNTQLVITTGLDELWKLTSGGNVEAGETVVTGLAI
ncbi:MAG: hypothetical protein NVSMB57_15760 [Actinomycetota bacterium]